MLAKGPSNYWLERAGQEQGAQVNRRAAGRSTETLAFTEMTGVDFNVGRRYRQD